MVEMVGENLEDWHRAFLVAHHRQFLGKRLKGHFE
jgi:hypothetical protein